MHNANNLQLRKSIRLLKESGNGCDCAIALKQTKSAKCNFEWDVNRQSPVGMSVQSSPVFCKSVIKESIMTLNSNDLFGSFQG